MTQAYEAVYENGAIQLPANVRLPEHTKVYVVVPESDCIDLPKLEPGRAIYIRSPRLAHPEQYVDFIKEVAEEDADAPL